VFILKEIEVCNQYIKGISTLLHDYLPGVFPADCLSCAAEGLSHTSYSPVKWTLKAFLHDKLFVFNVDDGLEILPHQGIINPFSKELITPLVLIERKSRLIAMKIAKDDTSPKNEIAGEDGQRSVSGSNKVNAMILDDFFVIRGAYLAKALLIASLFMESFFMSENEGKSLSEIAKKPAYVIRDMEEINRVKRSESFLMKLAMTLNHTFRGTEQVPIYIEDDQGVIKKVRSIQCQGFLPLLVKNSLHLESEKRKIVYHSQKVSKGLRLPHFSHLGRIDMLETPESESIGLTLFLARGAVYDPSSLVIQSAEADLIKHHPDQVFSLSSSCVPFLNHSDGPRVSMGGKNLKQAIPVLGAEKPLITTGVEEKAGLDFGVNALVGYMLYDGLNFEDGLVISKSFAQKMAVTRIRDLKSAFLIDFYKREKFSSHVTTGDFKVFHSLIDHDEAFRYRVTYKYRFRGVVRDGDPLLMMSVEKSKLIEKGERGGQGAQYSNKWVQEDFSIKENDEVKSYSKRVLVSHRGLYPAVLKDVFFDLKKLEYAQILNINGSLKKTHIESCEVVFKVEEQLPFEIGDKLTGRHGNKATVSKILPDERMPTVVIGGKSCVLDALISPMSVMSRMNLGQLLEVHASVAYGERTFKPFEPVDQQDLLLRLKSKGSDEWGYFRLEDGRRIAAGYQYMVRLDHCVRNKLHVVRHARVSELNAQPLKGRKRFGGQRIGEMEYWTLFSHGALNVIDDFSRTNLLEDDPQMKPLYSSFQEKHVQVLEGLMTMASFGNIEDAKKDFTQSFVVDSRSENDQLQTSLFSSAYKDRLAKEKFDRQFLKFMRKNRKRGFQLLKGKDGYLRKHMLGRRIHFSGRATISPDPDLAIELVYLPVDMGIEWFGHLSGLTGKFTNKQIQNAKQGDYSLRKQMASDLSQFVRFADFLVILNRQPSLHRHSMQAFYPIFWEHYSIGLPTMVCEGFGADFDGDTMACYFPVSQFSSDDDRRQCTHQELLNMLPTQIPYRLGDRGLAWSNAQDFAFGQYEINQIGKDAVENEINRIVSSIDCTNRLNAYKNKIIQKSTEGELSISFFDISTPLNDEHPGPFLHVFKDSEARGKDKQFNQMAKSIDILGPDAMKNFGDGLTLTDYICTRKTDHLQGVIPYPIAVRSRNNLMEKKLSVASAGYFTRKLVSFLYPYAVKAEDCGTDRLLEFTREQFDQLHKESDGKFSLKRLILGRFIKRNGKLVLVDESILQDIEKEDWHSIEMRSPVTCNCHGGVCSKCYGADISKPVICKEALPGIGDFVGLSSGHSLGEFGTQLSMKTFQTGQSFTPDALSRLFFSRFQSKEKDNKKIKIVDYYGYLMKIAREKVDKKSLFDAIGTFSIHLEVLFAYLVEKEIFSEAEMKQMFKHVDQVGIFSSLSFESFEAIFKKNFLEGVQDTLTTDEFSPSIGYMFANPVTKKVIRNG